MKVYLRTKIYTMKKLFTFLFLVIFIQLGLAQNQSLTFDYYFGSNVATQKFTYEGKELGHYSLGWFYTPNAAELRMSGYDGIKMFTAKTPRLYIHKLGNVGIGLTSVPLATLDIKSHGSNQDVLRLSHFGSPDQAAFIIGYGSDKDGNADRLVRFKTEYGDVKSNVFHINRLNQNFIYDGTGNVGIGTDTPESKLSVNGSIRQSGYMYTPFTWRIIDAQHDRPIISTGWIAGVGDYLNIAHSGANENSPTFAFRVSDAKGFEFGKDDFNNTFVRINTAGNVGIGTDPVSHAKLAVNGTIYSTEVKVKTDITVPDYVFQPSYQLRSLEEVKAYVTENSHLPEVPSAAEIGKEGLKLAEMNLLLLKKVEELTLYQIQLNETVQKQAAEIAQLKKAVDGNQ